MRPNAAGLHPPSPLRRCLAAALLLVLLALSGCSATVGDACEAHSDCGATMFCERSLPGGYCTRKDCEVNGCPDGGVCIVFEYDVSYCMADCADNGDCRDGYECVKDFGAHAFCNDKRGEAPKI